MFEPIDLSCYADSEIDALVSGPGRPLDSTPIFTDFVDQAQGTVLELGCGLGRYTIPLAARGIHVIGLELSTPSLAYAKRQAGDLPIEWIEADVRDFHLGRRFSRIFARGCIFDFMLTRRDQEAMLACVHEHLTDDGQFLFDTCNKAPYEMIDRLEEEPWYTLNHPNGRTIHVSGKTWYDHTEQLEIQVGYERWDGPDGDLVRHDPWTLTLRYTLPQELESLLHYNGFEIVSKYTEHDGTLPTPQVPPSVFICQKRQS